MPAKTRLSSREQLVLGGMAGAFPDIDFAGFLVDPLEFLASWHQGPTHSLLLLPCWAALIAAVFVFARKRTHAFAHAAALSALGIASHIASDAITAYGTAVLYPWSDLRVGLAVSYVIDPIFTFIVFAGLLAVLATDRKLIAVACLGVLFLYVAGLAHLQQRAIEIARASAHAQGLSFDRLVALAQPFSPFNWKLIGAAGLQYHEAYVNIAGNPLSLPMPERLAAVAAAYRSPSRIEWLARHRYGANPELHSLVEKRWNDPRFARYRRFAIFPALSRIDEESGVCVWFTDLRYDLPALPDTFRYGFCRDDASAPWQVYRLRYFSNHSRQRLSSASHGRALPAAGPIGHIGPHRPASPDQPVELESRMAPS